MARQIYGNLDLVGNQVLNFAVQVLASAPTGFLGRMYYDSVLGAMRYHNGVSWTTLGEAGSGGPPSGAAGGSLTGNYPNPTIAAGAVGDAEVSTIPLTKITGHDSAAHSGINAGTATALQTARTITLSGGVAGSAAFDGSTNITITTTLDLSAHLAAANPHPGYQLESQKGAANGYAPLDANNLIPTVHMPPLTINEVFTVADQAAMLALTAQRGDMAIRTDNGNTYVLATDSPSTLADWKEIGGAGDVVSVNGQTGVVSLTATDVGAVPTARTVTAGSGLTDGGALSGNITLNVGAGNGISVTADTVAVQAADATLSVAAGGVSVVSAPRWTTGRTISLTGAVTGTSAAFDGSGNLSITTAFGAAPGYAADLAGTAGEVVTHNLNTRDVQVAVYRTSGSYEEVDVEVERTSVNTVTLRSNPALGAGFRVVVAKAA